MARLAVFMLCWLFAPVECFLFNDQTDGSDSLPSLAEPPLRIGSFNIQVFGTTKMSQSDIVNVLVKVKH